MWNLPACVSKGQGHEEMSFEAMQLSTQGAERQRKNVACTHKSILNYLVEHPTKVLTYFVLQINKGIANELAVREAHGRMQIERILC